MKRHSILAAVLVVMTGSAYAADFTGLQSMTVPEVKAVAAEAPAPAAAGKSVLRANGLSTPIDGWLDGRTHDHEAPGPLGPRSKYVLYATMVKDEGALYLQAFAPAVGKMDYLADFKTSPEYALEDISTLRSDHGYPYIVAFEHQNYSPAVALKVKMLVVEFNSGKMMRFAIVREIPVGNIKDGKFKAYVPSDANNGDWSPWMEVK